MNPLVINYKVFIKAVISFVITVQIFLVMVLVKSDKWVSNLGGVEELIKECLSIIGIPSIGIFGILLIWLYEHYLWKLLHPQYDFTGKWFLIDRFYVVNPISSINATNIIRGWF